MPYRLAFAEGRLESCHDDASSRWWTRGCRPHCQIGPWRNESQDVYTIFGAELICRGQMVGIKAVWSVCGKCEECKDGEDALCSNGVSSGAHKSGTFQEYAIGPASYVTPVPDGIDPLIAAPVMVPPLWCTLC